MIWDYWGKKYFLVIFGHFWGRLSFDLKIFARKRPPGVEIYQVFLYGESEKNGLGTICWPPRFQLKKIQKMTKMKSRVIWRHMTSDDVIWRQIISDDASYDVRWLHMTWWLLTVIDSFTFLQKSTFPMTL